MPRYEATFEFMRSNVVEEALASLTFEGIVGPERGATMNMAGSRLAVSLEAPDKNEAMDRSTALVERFRRLTILKIGHFVARPSFLGLDREDGSPDSVIPGLLVTFNIINKGPEEIRRDAVAAAVEACRVNHPALDKAAAYFEHGAYATLERKGADPDLVSTAFDAVDGILNFHKSLELLLGEHPEEAILRVLEPDDQRRRVLKRRLAPVYELRHHYDVAHPRLDWTRLEELRERAGACREATRAVLLLYLDALERGEQVPVPVKRRNFDGTSMEPVGSEPA